MLSQFSTIVAISVSWVVVQILLASIHRIVLRNLSGKTELAGGIRAPAATKKSTRSLSGLYQVRL